MFETNHRFAALLVIVFLALTVPTYAEVLWEWPYDIDQGNNNLPGSYGDFYMADDFELSDAASVESVRVYGCYINGTPGSDFDVFLYTDDGGAPGAELIAEVCYPDNYWGGDTWGYHDYAVYRTDLVLADPILLDPGDYWLCVHYSGDRWYWFADETDGNAHRDDGSGWEEIAGSYQLVFTVYGEWSGSNIEPASWGRIKVLD
ncbi:MAG: hypothetical protein GF399_04660 [Candidatus Coatesbacteria bacterium]|nr:hypothetical protein [Candidatus Coatesbacteria bacterium]